MYFANSVARVGHYKKNADSHELPKEVCDEMTVGFS